MLSLLQQGQYSLFALLIVALVLSLSFHEFGHAFAAKTQGDNTAEQLGRLTVNPIAHIDPMGLLMVVMVGFGYARPVPFDPRNFRSRWSEVLVAVAGPFMNLLVAVVSWNTLLWLDQSGNATQGMQLFFVLLAQINLLLMLFNMLPLGPLDGHYLVVQLLPERWREPFRFLNARWGTLLLLSLILLNIFGVPVFAQLLQLAESLLPWITFI